MTGLDLSSTMLAKAVRRFLEAGKEPDFIHASAIDFSLERTFDAVYVYSGHILLNRRDGGLFTNGITEELRTALKGAHGHLESGGQILLGIEKWENEGESELFLTHDGSGSWYQRWITEENDHFGARLHVFFDKPSSKIYVEESESRHKLSGEHLIAALEDVGFVESAESEHFSVARRP